MDFQEIIWMFWVCRSSSSPAHAEPPNNDIFVWPLTHLLFSCHYPILLLGILSSKSKALLKQLFILVPVMYLLPFRSAPSFPLLCSVSRFMTPVNDIFPTSLTSGFWLSLATERHWKGTGGKEEGISQCIFLSLFLPVVEI